LSEEVDSNATS